jgi:Icc-related predicted phosphoesterase
MRVAALYDIHANPVALRAVLAELEQEPVDLIVVGGDAVPGPPR